MSKPISKADRINPAPKHPEPEKPRAETLAAVHPVLELDPAEHPEDNLAREHRPIPAAIRKTICPQPLLRPAAQPHQKIFFALFFSSQEKTANSECLSG